MKTRFLDSIFTNFVKSDVPIYLLWVLLFFLLIGSYVIHYFSIFIPALFANMGVIVFLSFRKQEIPERKSDLVEREKGDILKTDRTILVIAVIFFFIFYSLSLLLLLLESYSINILYYLCVAICVAILIFKIFSFKSRVSRYFILFQTFLLSLNIVFANHLIFIHGITQLDYYFHIRFVKAILTSGHITTFNDYGLVNIFAIHHIFASEITLLTGYDLQAIYLLFGSLIVAIGVLFVFIIGKRFINFQFGLVAAVLFTCLDFYLMWAEHPEHVAYCFGFAVICFTIILYTYKIQKPAFYLLFVFSAIAMVFTHHLTAIILFVTIFSLVLIDIFYLIKTKERSFPSKYITIFFSILLFIAFYFISGGDIFHYVTSFSEQYTGRISTLITNFLPAPTQVVSIPTASPPATAVFTAIPTAVTTAVPTAVTTAVPTAVTTAVPTAADSIRSMITSPPTGYDNMPIITLFVNILGSSLLVFVSILGFCSLIKKRSWFGDFTILNAVIISFLLGLGILFPVVVFLPDRMYPLLQIFGLVFLGAFGIIWLHNAIPVRNRLIVVAGICLLVGLLSFFSLASIINGFETSPFADDNIAYFKYYTTSQDVSFGEWCNSFISEEKRAIEPVPINDQGGIDVLPDKSYIYFDRTIEKTGIVKAGWIFGQLSFVRINDEQLHQLKSVSTYYDNGQTKLMANFTSL